MKQGVVFMLRHNYRLGVNSIIDFVRRPLDNGTMSSNVNGSSLTTETHSTTNGPADCQLVCPRRAFGPITDFSDFHDLWCIPAN